MLGLFKPIVLPGLLGLALLALARFVVTQPLYQALVYGAGIAFLAVAAWVVTAMVTGWSVSSR